MSSNRHATVVAYLALFVALGGSAVAVTRIDSGDIANNTVRSKDIRNRTIAGKDVKNNALGGGQVNEARLGAVRNANALGGAPAGDYVKNGTALGGALTGTLPNPGLATQIVSLTLNSGWADPNGSPRAIKDASGFVHLDGDIVRSSGTEPVAFTLPPGFRPAGEIFIPILVSEGIGQLGVSPSGEAEPDDVTAGGDAADYTSITGVSFFAGS